MYEENDLSEYKQWEIWNLHVNYLYFSSCKVCKGSSWCTIRVEGSNFPGGFDTPDMVHTSRNLVANWITSHPPKKTSEKPQSQALSLAILGASRSNTKRFKNWASTPTNRAWNMFPQKWLSWESSISSSPFKTKNFQWSLMICWACPPRIPVKMWR